MLTRREVEGELRSLHPFRTSVRNRRAERERARRFVRGVLGVLFGVGLVALLGAVNLLRATPADYATGHSSSRGGESVGSGSQTPRRALSLFFTSRRTWHPNDPRSRRRHKNDDL
jgi:hypothetical protein